MKLLFSDYLKYTWNPKEFIIGIGNKDFDRPVPRGRDTRQFLPRKMNVNRFNLSSERKDILCFSSFSISTFKVHRERVFQELIDKDFITHGLYFNKWSPRKSEKENSSFLNSIRKSKFCISPQGNGVDCFRTWDCLYEKCIPIVPHYEYYWKSTPQGKKFEKRLNEIMYRYKTLPILFIKNYSSLTESYLHEKYDEILNTEYDFSQLKLSHWTKLYPLHKLSQWITLK